MKKIVVFGATGNIGVYLVDYLKSRIDASKYEIIAVGRKDTDFFDSIGVRYIRLDVCDKAGFSKLPSDVYAVVNLAGILPAYLNGFDPYKYLDVNVYGAINIIEYAVKHNADRILYTQTWSDLAGYWGKESVLRPYMERKLRYTGDHAFYSITKNMIVDTLKFYKQEYGLKDFIFRLPNIYLYSPLKYYYVDGQQRYISYRYMIDKAINGEDIELWGDPEAFKDIVYVKDLCQMMWRALFTQKDEGIYNAGTGVKTTLKEQIEGMIEVFSPAGRKPKIIMRPEKGSFDSFVMDIDNAKADLGYAPEYFYKDYLEDYKKEMELKRFDTLFKG